MNYISYSLFTTKNLNQRLHRDWDSYRTETDRYWYIIPSLYIINSQIYKDFKIIFYISPEICEHPLFPILKELEKQNNVILKVIKSEYKNTEPTMWRMIPLWFNNINVLLCRDIDSLPTKNEVKATKSFIDSKYLIHSIRSHRQHNSHNTRLLAGLCGFKKEVLKLEELSMYKTFIDYYKHNNSGWGCDQDTLINLFYTNIKNKKDIILDTPLKTDIHDVIPNTEISFIDYTENDYEHEILTFIDSFTIWSGEPIDFRKDKLKQLLNFDYKECHIVKEILENNEVLKNFYLND